MEKNIFKKIIDGEIPVYKVYEDDKTLAFLDIAPTNKGHTLVIPKESAENIYDIKEESLKSLIITTKKIAEAVKIATKADGINIIQNNEATAGQVIFHIHFHVIPRFKNDGLRNWPAKEYDSEEEKERIRKNIESVIKK